MWWYVYDIWGMLHRPRNFLWLFGMVKWPFQMVVGDLQVSRRSKGHELNHLVLVSHIDIFHESPKSSFSPTPMLRKLRVKQTGIWSRRPDHWQRWTNRSADLSHFIHVPKQSYPKIYLGHRDLHISSLFFCFPKNLLWGSIESYAIMSKRLLRLKSRFW